MGLVQAGADEEGTSQRQGGNQALDRVRARAGVRIRVRVGVGDRVSVRGLGLGLGLGLGIALGIGLGLGLTSPPKRSWRRRPPRRRGHR